MDVLVTGGAGFIGSHLVESLVGAGHQVRVLDDFATGKPENLARVAGQVQVLEGSILDTDLLAQVLAGVEVVFHQAAIPSVPRSVRNPAMSNEVNVTGTLNLLIAARDAGVRRLVYAASSSAYGAATGEARVESMPARPQSPYAVAKLAGEQYCQVFAQIYDLETVCLRYFNIFGPRQDPNSEYAAVIPKFITALLAGQPLTVYGDGTQSRDFTYVGNAVAANLRAMVAPAASGKVFNIGCGQQTRLIDLITQLARIAGVEPEIQYLPARSGDVAHSLADVSLARSVLGYEPAVPFARGLRRTWEHFAGQTRARTRTTKRSLAVSSLR